MSEFLRPKMERMSTMSTTFWIMELGFSNQVLSPSRVCGSANGAAMVLLHLPGFNSLSSSKHRIANSGKSLVPLGASQDGKSTSVASNEVTELEFQSSTLQ